MNLSFIKQLKIIFASMAIVGLISVGYTLYRDYRFEQNPLPEHLKQKLAVKEQEIIARIKQHYGIDFDVPVLVSEKMPSNMYGVATKNQAFIRVILNKNRMKESFPYMLNDVLPHEYAHALMFYWGYNSVREGHGPRWQKTCQNLGGMRCRRFVDGEDILMGKIPF